MFLHPLHRFPDSFDPGAFIAAHPLGAWVCPAADGLVANHLPFVLDRQRGPQGTLLGHVSRANGVWRQLAAESACVVLFQGAQAYITPNWYPGMAEHGRVVPTWNYAVVHVHGVARVAHGREWLMDMLDRLTHAQESTQPAPWRAVDAPAEYIDGLLQAIVGIEIQVTRIEAKLKASQDEALADRAGTVQGLRAERSGSALAMADWVAQALQGDCACPRRGAAGSATAPSAKQPLPPGP